MATITISLPDQIAKKVDAEMRNNGFATRSEFIRSILRTHFTKPHFEAFTPRPIEEIKRELTQTGRYNRAFIESVVKGLSKSSVYDS